MVARGEDELRRRAEPAGACGNIVDFDALKPAFPG
jgi:hypothetical protein